MAWIRDFDDTVERENLPHKKIHGDALKTKKTRAALVLGAEGRNR